MAKRGRKKEYRIAIVGSAGTGKTSLARLISKSMDLSYVTSKKLVAEILKKDCYDFSSGIQVERFLAQGQRQERIVNHLIHEEKKRKRFVTDRPMMDLVAYAVAERHHADPNCVTKIYEKCMAHAKNNYTHVIICPWVIDKPIEDNGLRTLNQWYQLIIHSLAAGLVDEWGFSHYVVKEEKPEKRLQEVMEYLSQC